MTILLMVETNFAFGVCLEESPDLLELYRMGRTGEVQLVIPEICLGEAEAAIRQRLRRWQAQLQEMRGWFNPLREIPWARRSANGILRHLTTLENQLARQQKRIPRGLQRVARMCLTIPHTPEAHVRGRLRHLAGRPPFKETDCELFEAILHFLREHACDYTHLLFLNLDREDFDHPEIREDLSPFNVELYFAPGEVIGRIRQIMGVA